MISTCKAIVHKVITDVTDIPPSLILRSSREETQALKTGGAPFVVITTNPADFDDRHARIDTYYDKNAKVFKRRFIRGERRVPFTLKLYCKTEQAISDYLDAIIPAIPREFQHDGYRGSITIGIETHSEPEPPHNEVADFEVEYETIQLYSVAVQVLFAVAVATQATDVATATSTNSQSDYKKP